jgi:hypothetical protein
MHTKASSGNVKSISCRLPAESANYLMNVKRSMIAWIEKSFRITISIISDTKPSGGQYSLEVVNKEKVDEDKKQDTTEKSLAESGGVEVKGDEAARKRGSERR